MPYILKDRRSCLVPAGKVETIGELNYMMTALAVRYIRDHGLGYEQINAVMGVFACAAQEFYDRVAKPYEAKKRKKNGDVY